MLQHFPFLKSLFTDELTLLAKKDAFPPIGFELNRVKQSIAKNKKIK